MNLEISLNWLKDFKSFLNEKSDYLVAASLSALSVVYFIYFYNNGLAIAYNDARSHLDIARRVVEGLNHGFAQIGSVWLPLLHILMIPTIGNDFLWHSGLSGSLISMISFVFTGVLINRFLKEIGAGFAARLIAVFVYAFNLNILYMQSIAMTEMLLLATMTAGTYELMVWYKTGNYLNIIKAAFWIMLSTLTRYDGWFLLAVAGVLVLFRTLPKRSWKYSEGVVVLFSTLAFFGIILWLGWNLVIFRDIFYFAFGPFSAKAQQDILLNSGNLPTKGNLLLSAKIYFYALMYNSGSFNVVLGLLGLIMLVTHKKLSAGVRLASLALLAPLLFNILALYLGHSVLYIQGISGNTWFNARYGLMLVPTIAIFIGYLYHRLSSLRRLLVAVLLVTTFLSLFGGDAVTIDDAQIGSSQKNVTEVAHYLQKNAVNTQDFILISVASHDAIIFSSGLPMSRFIHEGAGAYWTEALADPSRYAHWIIMRSGDNTDLLYRSIKDNPSFINKYQLAGHYPFADIYELKSQYRFGLQKYSSVISQNNK